MIFDIFRLRYGASFEASSEQARRAFCAELISFRGKLPPSERELVTLTAIKNWIFPRGDGEKTSAPKKLEALRFLYQYVTASNKLSKADKTELDDLAEELDGLVHAKMERNRHTSDYENPQNPFLVDQTLLSILAPIVAVSSRNTQSEKADLFRGGGAGRADESYFLMYRYSTNNSEIVKSLMTICTPQITSDTYSFNHFLWFRRKADVNRETTMYRECRGVVAKMAAAYYFIGCNCTVPIDRFGNEEKYEKLRQERLKVPSGIGVISVEYASIVQNPELFAGVTMTLAASNQPIIARVVLLHIGTKSALGFALRDLDVIPGGIDEATLASDILQTIESIREKKPQELSEYLEKASSAPDWTTGGAKELAQQIIDGIDNVPAWEASQQKSVQLLARGAIETSGNKPPRPRD